jgi:DNA-directed RNA polymerase alpha subunit
MEQLLNNQFEQTKGIDDVLMSLRLNQLLRSKDILTLEEVITKGEAYFTHENIPGFASKDLKELKGILAENNLTFS